MAEEEKTYGLLTSFAMKSLLPSILANLPYEWRGTTFANSALLGRAGFSANLTALLQAKLAAGVTTVTEAELTAAGNAEDYLRVSSNISTLLEMVLAIDVGVPVDHVFTFGSVTMPIVAVLMTAQLPVVLYYERTAPFTQAQLDQLAQVLNFRVTMRQGEPVADAGAVVLSFQGGWRMKTPGSADGIITHNSILYIHNAAKIVPSEVLVIRKRLATPLTTPVCERMLQELAGVDVTADADEATAEQYVFEPLPQGVAAFHAHLQTMSGTDAKADANPVVFTSGLPSICAMWLALLATGGADILMASTAYGGSSQLTDIISKRNPALFQKHTFDITGKNDISAAIEGALTTLEATAKCPTTVLFVEIPTNPDMKVPDMAVLARLLTSYQEKAGKEVVLLVDTTFAPASQVMRQMSAVAPALTTAVFVSMSKSVSRGLTTAGAIVANSASAKSCAILANTRAMAEMLDTTAKKDQMFRLAGNHTGVEARCQQAYEVAVAVGHALVAAVKMHARGYDMELAFVTEAQAASGFSSSTFSFNLPPLPGATAAQNEALAQVFVDRLTVDPAFKPCVSFGQDNGLIYCTVPATSTQGAIKAEDKAKQAVGGVQLTRLSFPPKPASLPAVIAHIEGAVRSVYGGQ